MEVSPARNRASNGDGGNVDGMPQLEAQAPRGKLGWLEHPRQKPMVNI